MKRTCIIFIIFSNVFLFSSSVSAEKISVTANVDISPVWAQAIAEYSHITIKTGTKDTITIRLTIQGIEKIVLKNQRIEARLYKNNHLHAVIYFNSEDEVTVNKNDFERIIFTDSTYETKAFISSLSLPPVHTNEFLHL